MKSLAIVLSFLGNPSRRRNFLALGRLLVVFVVMVLVFTIVFHWLMDMEGQKHSWATGIYWVLVVMSTLGFGDITFHSDIGRLFSVVVLLSGSVFMLMLLPFMFIQFFYVPWLDAQNAARAPRELSPRVSGHVIITGLSSVERSLILMLEREKWRYVLLVGELSEALRLYDEGFSVLLGDIDDPETYVRARAENAALVVAAQRDTTNTNIAFTVREISTSVTIVAIASFQASIDILKLAGCNQVLQLGEMLGQSFARRVYGRDARSLVVGEFGNLLIAEAAAAGTPMVGRSLKDIRLTDYARISVIGVWNRGHFSIAGPNTVIESSTILLLAGTRDELDEYDSLFCIYRGNEPFTVILGAGRVGRATGKELLARGTDYRIVDRNPDRIRDPEHYVLGDAAELEVLERAGIMTCSSVVITTHDDDINIYLAIYCRRLRPDIQILARANQDRNVSTLHRAGADYVMSYASTGANSIFNILKRGDSILLAEGLDVFRVPVPTAMIGRTLAECQFRQKMGCNVVAIEKAGEFNAKPSPSSILTQDSQLVIVADAESERKFFEAMNSQKR
jgi:Trk K+ transport system NAD-binding subunit